MTTAPKLPEGLEPELRLLAASMRHSAGQWMVPGWDGHKVAVLLEKAQAALQALAAEKDPECETLREDAARFAWLLDNANIDFDPSEPYQLVIWEPGTGDDWKSIVRAAIDAARAAADQGGA